MLGLSAVRFATQQQPERPHLVKIIVRSVQCGSAIHCLGAYAAFIEEKHIAVKGAVVASWNETIEMEYDASYNQADTQTSQSSPTAPVVTRRTA